MSDKDLFARDRAEKLVEAVTDNQAARQEASTCGTCRNVGHLDLEKIDDFIPICRAYPPQPNGTFPHVDIETDWCGLWAPQGN